MSLLWLTVTLLVITLLIKVLINIPLGLLGLLHLPQWFSLAFGFLLFSWLIAE